MSTELKPTYDADGGTVCNDLKSYQRIIQQLSHDVIKRSTVAQW